MFILDRLVLHALACAGTVLLPAVHAQTQATQARSSIWISPRLGLAPGASIADALAAPFDAPYTVTTVRLGTTVTPGESDQRTSRILRNCNDYLPVESSIVSAGSAIDLRSLHYRGTQCDALALLRIAKPAHLHSLANFSWRHLSLRDLPPQLALALSPDQSARNRSVAAHNGSIRTVDPSVKLHPLNATQTELNAKDWTATLTLYGRADFTGSGEDALLVRRDASVKHGTYTTSSLFLLTRNRATGRLQIAGPQP